MKSGDCPICFSAVRPRFRLFDDRYGYPGTFELAVCPHCNHRTLRGDFSPGQLGELYTDFYPRSSYSLDDFRPALGMSGFSAWLQGAKASAYLWVPKNVRILDVGCGFGETLAYHRNRGCDVYGVEADENIRRVAERFDFNVQVGLFDPSRYEADYFDYVTLDQVIEHVTDPVETLHGISRILKPGGTAILGTPNAGGWGAKLFGRRWINWHVPYHLQHFSKQSMRIASEKAGLKVERVMTLTNSEWLHYQWIHALTYPEVGKPSPFWSPNGKRKLHVLLILGVLAVVHRTKINHVITRLFDSLGIGDNSLFFLRKQ
jgi:SAM-dependent methyltransferase